MSLVDWIGSFGVFQILLAYVLNLYGKIKKEELTFILLNFLGGSLACLASVLMKYIPFIILEGLWAFISLISLLKYKKVKKN